MSCLVVAGYRMSPGARGSVTQQAVVLALLITAAVIVGRELFFLGSPEWVYLVSEMVFALCAVFALTFYFYSRILVPR
jgi:membrane protein YdbS with pleckstrin-like domain